MKKIAVAVTAALLAGSAFAANVDVYGRIDTGLSYAHERQSGSALAENSSTDTLSMDSGNFSGSRWGLKGSEDLGGAKLGFVLESGFSSDDGKSGQGGRLFGREASVSVSGKYGTVYAGRLGSLISDAGSAGWYGSMASPFGSGIGDIAGHEAVMSMQGRKDNTLIYFSPKFSGVQLSAQYSFGDNGDENTSYTDRYAALGVSYDGGPLQIGFLADYLNKNSEGALAGVEVKDAYTFNLAASYDCGFATTYAAVQYFDRVADIGGVVSNIPGSMISATDERIAQYLTFKGVGANLGVSVPLFGGSLGYSVGYADADAYWQSEKSGKAKVFSTLAAYSYPFSKKTSVYAAAGYTQQKLTSDVAGTSAKIQETQVMAGLLHKF